MKFASKMFISVLGLILVATMVLAVYADRNPARDVAADCKVELNTYCKDVTPGGGRILSCLHAYSDKLSETCKATVSEAAGQIKALGAALAFVKSECEPDLQQFCKDVPAGEGRLMNCLDKNDEKLSQGCRAALKDVGLRE